LKFEVEIWLQKQVSVIFEMIEKLLKNI